MILSWPQNNRETNIFKFQKGMYFIGDLNHVFRNINKNKEGIKNKAVLSKKLISELDIIVDSYSNIDTGIYTDTRFEDYGFEDQDGYFYNICFPNGELGISRVDENLVQTILKENSEEERDVYLMFYKRLIVKVRREEVSIVKPKKLSHLKLMGRFVYFHNDFNVEFINSSKGIQKIKFGEIELQCSGGGFWIRSDRDTIKQVNDQFFIPFINEKSELGNWTRIILRLKGKNHIKALKSLNELVKNSPSKETFYLRGLLKTNDNHLKDLEGGIEDLNKAIEIDSYWHLPYFWRSKAFEIIGEQSKSKEDQQKANEIYKERTF